VDLVVRLTDGTTWTATVFTLEGFAWVTSHVFRNAAIVDRAGLTARVIADQLGHSKPSMTRDVFHGRQLVSPVAAEALEGAAVKPAPWVS
jgi:integrase